MGGSGIARNRGEWHGRNVTGWRISGYCRALDTLRRTSAACAEREDDLDPRCITKYPEAFPASRDLLTTPVAELLPGRERCLALAATPDKRALEPCPKCRTGFMQRVAIVPAYRWPEMPLDTS